jgi:hypothetical protein
MAGYIYYQMIAFVNITNPDITPSELNGKLLIYSA